MTRWVQEFIARICGTKPIHIRFAADAFVFSHGEFQRQVTPIVWFERSAGSGRIVAVGDQSPPPHALAVHLLADSIVAVPLAQRERALEALLRYSIKSLKNPARFPIQLPAVVFENDTVLAAVFENRQREVLARAVKWAAECRFE